MRERNLKTFLIFIGLMFSYPITRTTMFAKMKKINIRLFVKVIFLVATSKCIFSQSQTDTTKEH